MVAEGITEATPAPPDRGQDAIGRFLGLVVFSRLDLPDGREDLGRVEFGHAASPLAPIGSSAKSKTEWAPALSPGAVPSGNTVTGLSLNRPPPA